MKDVLVRNLEDNEKILFYGVAHVDKTSKQLGRWFVVAICLILFWLLVIVSLNSYSIIELLPMLILLAFFSLTLIYGLIYNAFFKYKSKNNEYFVTNKKIGIYNPQKDFTIKYIADIEHLSICREKDNYGDICFNFHAESYSEQLLSPKK